MPAVEKITIQGFKSICDADVELRPVNVLIGANRSGKSNFIGAFDFFGPSEVGSFRTTSPEQEQQTRSCILDPE